MTAEECCVLAQFVAVSPLAFFAAFFGVSSMVESVRRNRRKGQTR
jgi:hypothetical protein